LDLASAATAAEVVNACWCGLAVMVKSDSHCVLHTAVLLDIFVQTGPGAHPASCKMGTRSFMGVKCGWSVLLTTHPLLVHSHGRVELYLYPPSGPHQACNGKTLPLHFLLDMFRSPVEEQGIEVPYL